MKVVNETSVDFVFAFFSATLYVVVNYWNAPRLYRILFIILIRLCIHYADRCCINLDNWNIFQQHKWNNYAWFFCFQDDNENEAVEAHILRPQETETNKPRHRDSKTFFQRTKSHDIEIPRIKNHDIKIPRTRSHDIDFFRNSDPYAPW